MDGAAAIGETLKDNRGNLDRTLKSAAELTAKLNESATKIDGLMTSAQSFLGSPDTKGPLAQVGDAAKSIKALADETNMHIRQLSSGLVRFSGSGLKEYEEMAVDARKTLADVDRVFRSIEKNPSQLIFGAK
jgi:phospholipid/cholesterol/gamma-HCH transport system substrate-binding protein